VPKSEVLNTVQAARELRVSVRRVQQLIAAGRLPAERFGRDYMIKRTDLQRVRVRKPGRPWGKASPKSQS
jgi:excisionase family DNA binding protein